MNEDKMGFSTSFDLDRSFEWVLLLYDKCGLHGSLA